MRIKIKKEERSSIALSLTPEELIILFPNYINKSQKDLERIIVSHLSEIGDADNSRISRDEFENMISLWAKKLKVKPNRIQLRKMSKKWASCSENKNLTFHYSILNFPKEFVEYIVCHELLHLKVPNHGILFKSLLSAYVPDWENRIRNTIKNIFKEYL
jgi:hypothetical protein